MENYRDSEYAILMTALSLKRLKEAKRASKEHGVSLNDGGRISRLNKNKQRAYEAYQRGDLKLAEKHKKKVDYWKQELAKRAEKQDKDLDLLESRNKEFERYKKGQESLGLTVKDSDFKQNYKNRKAAAERIKNLANLDTSDLDDIKSRAVKVYGEKGKKLSVGEKAASIARNARLGLDRN